MATHGIARQDVDTAGGVQLNGGQSFVRLEGYNVVLLGDPVTAHGMAPHDAPVMDEGSPVMRIGGVPVCREGHLANCGHATTGSGLARLAD